MKQAQPEQYSIVPAVAAVVMTVLAVKGRWPHGFYQLLRLIVCGSSLYMARAAFRVSLNIWGWVFVALALLFNPLKPVYLTRGQWETLDLPTAARIRGGRRDPDEASMKPSSFNRVTASDRRLTVLASG